MIGFEYSNGTDESVYYYQRNLLGDVIAIYDTTGTKVVEYSYDAWGNCTIKDTTTNYILAHANPIRYRGYYYDEGTKLYYLNSRYYSPEWRRFISPDDTYYLDPESVNGLNLYCYCNNDPVNFVDPSGHLAISAILISMAIGFGIGAAVSGCFEVAAQIRANGWSPLSWDLEKIALSMLGGGVAGAITAIPVPSFAKLGAIGNILSYSTTFALGSLGTLAGGAVSGTINFNSSSEVAFAMVVGGFSNVVARGVGEIILKNKVNGIMNQTRKAKSLTIQKLQGQLGIPGAMKGSMRNAFKNYTSQQTTELLIATNLLIKYGVYSSFYSAWLSTFPYAI